MTNPTESGAPSFKRRRRLLVDKTSQFRMIRMLLGIWAVNTFFFAAVLYFFYRVHLIRFYDLVPARNEASTFSTGTLVALLVLYLVTFGLGMVAVIGLYFSNHVAGPLYRLKQSFLRLSSGDLKVDVSFRDGDFLTDFPETFNAMVQAFRDRETSDLEKLHAIETARDPEKVRALVAELRANKESRLGMPVVSTEERIEEVAQPVS